MNRNSTLTIGVAAIWFAALCGLAVSAQGQLVLHQTAR